MKVRKWIAIIALLCLGAVDADAMILMRGANSGSPFTTTTGAVGGFMPDDFPFVNLVKMAQGQYDYTAASANIIPNFLTADQYPNGTLPTNLGYTVLLPNNYFGRYVMKVSGAVSNSGMGFSTGPTGSFVGYVYATTGSPTILGCAAAPCFIQNNLIATGTDFSIEFDMSVPVSGAVNNGSGLVRLTTPTTTTSNIDNGIKVTVSGVVGSDGNGCGANGTWTIAGRTNTTIDLTGSTFAGGCTYTSGGQIFIWQEADSIPFTALTFFSGGTFASMTSVVICKKADYQADNTCNTTSGKTAWPSGFNDDFVQSLAAVKPRYIRYLDVFNQVFIAPADWASRSTSTLMTYYTEYWQKARWLGSTSGTNTYTATCSAPCTYTLTGGEPADGDVVQAYTANANTSKTVTLQITDKNSVTSSAWPVADGNGWITDNLVSGTITAGDVITLTFTSSCIGGGSTTAHYTVQGGDSANSVAIGLQTAILANAALTALPLRMDVLNPNGNGSFYILYGIQACSLTITPSYSGGATETVTIGTIGTGTIAAQMSNTYVFSSALKRWVMNNAHGIGFAWPYQTMIDLANAVSSAGRVNTGCWIQMNLLTSVATATSLFNNAAANPCTGGTWFEVGNEVWNPANFNTKVATNLAATIALQGTLGAPGTFVKYELVRTSQFAQLARTAFSGQLSNLHFIAAFQPGAASINYLAGVGLCGTSCSNTAYQNYIGVNYDTAPTQPGNLVNAISQAPYTAGAILSFRYFTSSDYGTWSATSSSISSNVLTVSGTVTGTIWPNNGVTNCSGVYIKTSTVTDWSSAQITGKVTTTLNGAVAANQTSWTLTSTAGVSAGMWIYNSTTGNPTSTVQSVDSGTTITVRGVAGYTINASAGSNDTIVFGGKAGSYRLNSTSCSVASTTITGGDILGLQYATDNYLSLNSALGSQQDAFDWFYRDSIVGTVKGLMEDHNTLQSTKADYASIKTAADAYSLPVQDYEGSWQGTPPNATDTTNIGLPSASYGGLGGYVNVVVNAWKNSSSFYDLETLKHSQEMAALPANSASNWFNYGGQSKLIESGTFRNKWGLFPLSLYSPPSWQSRAAMCNYNGGSC